MFKLFQKHKEPDGLALVKDYYQRGKACMEGREPARAMLWLSRADTIYSADDATYDKVGDKLIDDCGRRIGALEDEEALLYNAVPAEIEARAEELSDVQRCPAARCWASWAGRWK